MLSHDICDTHQQATVPLRVLLSALSLFSLRHCLTFIDPLHHKLNQQKIKQSPFIRKRFSRKTTLLEKLQHKHFNKQTIRRYIESSLQSDPRP